MDLLILTVLFLMFHITQTLQQAYPCIMEHGGRWAAQALVHLSGQQSMLLDSQSQTLTSTVRAKSAYSSYFRDITSGSNNLTPQAQVMI